MTDISMDREYRTRNDLEVEIYAIGRGGNHPVHGAVQKPNGEWNPVSWTKEGKFSPTRTTLHSYDLFEVKPKLTGWVNIFSSDLMTCGFITGGSIFPTKESAREATKSKSYITTVFLEIDPNDA